VHEKYWLEQCGSIRRYL